MSNELKRSSRLLALCLIAIVASCSPFGVDLGARQMVDGINCDPDRSVLLAEQTNEKDTNDADDLNRTRLYETVEGHYFVKQERDRKIVFELVSSVRAGAIYDSILDGNGDISVGD